MNVSLGEQSSASIERYAHVSGEETIETGESVSKRLYGQNADKNADKINFEKLQTPKSLLLFTEMDASLVGAPDFKPECTALTLSQIGSIPIHLRHPTDIIR